MQDLNRSAKKLIQALNIKGARLLYNRKQFLSKDGKVQTLYIISHAQWNESRDRYDSVEMYKTGSLIRIVLYLRDLLCITDGKPLPQDNQYWNDCRIYLKGRGIYPYGSNSTSESEDVRESEDEDFRS